MHKAAVSLRCGTTLDAKLARETTFDAKQNFNVNRPGRTKPGMAAQVIRLRELRT
jgi:hypothetical protein